MSRPPVQPATPQPLTPELSNLIRELGSRPAPAPAPPPSPRAEVIDVADVKQVGHEVPLSPGGEGRGEGAASRSDPSQQSHPFTPSPSPPGEGGAKPAKPLHAPLPAGKCVVYVLDRSSSMRLSPDTFAAARAAVLASVEGTPDGGRFQVVVYNGSADVLLPGTRGKLLATDAATKRKVAAALADLTPEGRSTHREGLAAAIALKADYVILVTDADADELADLKVARKAAAKPTAVYLARAGGGTVSKPEPLPE